MALLFFLFWMVLNGKVTWETAAFGAAVCALAMTFACRACGWSLDREKRLQKAVLSIKKRMGKNAILKGMSLKDGATGKMRNEQIGGHRK